MTSFLKLSSMVINTRYINRIYINPSSYSIHLMDNYDGSIIGSAMFFWGSASSDKVINICFNEQEEDYNTIKEWILETNFLK